MISCCPASHNFDLHTTLIHRARKILHMQQSLPLSVDHSSSLRVPPTSTPYSQLPKAILKQCAHIPIIECRTPRMMVWWATMGFDSRCWISCKNSSDTPTTMLYKSLGQCEKAPAFEVSYHRKTSDTQKEGCQ